MIGNGGNGLGSASREGVIGSCCMKGVLRRRDVMEEEEEDVGEEEDEDGGVEEDAEVVEIDDCGGCCFGGEVKPAMVAHLACLMRESIAGPSLSPLNFPRIDGNAEIV